MIPLFPKLHPRIVDSAWFNVDQPYDDGQEVDTMEQEHVAWIESITHKNSDLTPIGKTTAEQMEEEDDDEDEDDNDDDDESDTHDEEDEDEIEVEMSQEHTSPGSADNRLNNTL